MDDDKKLVSAAAGMLWMWTWLVAAAEGIPLLDPSRSFEIKGYPIVPKENLKRIARTVGMVIGVRYPDHVDTVVRMAGAVGKTGRPASTTPIAVQVANMQEKDEWLTKGRFCYDLRANSCDRTLQPFKLYFNEHLDFETRRFLSDVKRFAKKNRYKYIYTNHSEIYIRKDEFDFPYHVRNWEDLMKLNTTWHYRA